MATKKTQSAKKPAAKKPAPKKPAVKPAAKTSEPTPVAQSPAPPPPPLPPPEFPIVHMKCKRGSDRSTEGQSCMGMKAENRTPPGSPTSHFKCTSCGHYWAVSVGGAFNYLCSFAVLNVARDSSKLAA